MIKIPSGIIVHSSISHGKSSNDSRGNHGKIPAQIMEASSHGWLPEGKKKHVVHWKKNWNAAQRWKKSALLHHLIYMCELFMYMYMNYNIYIYIYIWNVYIHIYIWNMALSENRVQAPIHPKVSSHTWLPYGSTPTAHNFLKEFGHGFKS